MRLGFGFDRIKGIKGIKGRHFHIELCSGISVEHLQGVARR
jgi:hypothetical protein